MICVRRVFARLWILTAVLVPFRAHAGSDGTPAVEVSRASVASDGTEANDWSSQATLSGDGRYVCFFSYANNLVPQDRNGRRDIFVHDRLTRSTSRVSVASDGTEGNSWSGYAQISADGRWVAFQSGAGNLVSDDHNWDYDVFVHDRSTRTTTLVSRNTDGAQGNRASNRPSLSADGRFVAFRSRATNLVVGDTNGLWDIFVRDRQSGQTTRVSVASDGTQANGDSPAASISPDGRWVVFNSEASNLVPDDTNDRLDVFVHDRLTGRTERVNVADDGTQTRSGWSQNALWGAMSTGGRFITFFSESDNLVPGDNNGKWDVFVRDLATRTTRRVSLSNRGEEADGNSIRSTISADGRFVTFTSEASNLVDEDTNGTWDIFVHDRLTGSTRRANVAADGSQANANCWMESAVSADGQVVAYLGNATNLIKGDTNGHGDIYVHQIGSETTFADGFESGALTAWIEWQP